MGQMGEGMGCVGADSMGGLGGSMGGVSISMGSLSGRPSWTDYSTAKRPNFVLDTVFKPPTLLLPLPIPVPSVTTKTSAQHYEKTATNKDDKPKHVPSAIDQQPAEQSTPPIEQKTIVVRKEQTESDLPKGSARRLLIEIEEKVESTKGVKKIKYDN
ncbi:hypothetical protein Tco_0545238 [Tanacetum coccineum]